MKISIVVSVLLALLFSLVGWHNQSELAEARKHHDGLLAEAARLGIEPEASGKASSSSRRDRPDRTAVAKSTATDLLALAREFEERMKQGDHSDGDDNLQARILEIMDRMASLDTAQIKTLIDTVRADATLSDQMRYGLIGFAIENLANSHPKAALELLTASSDLLPKGMMAQHTVSNALGRWGKESPEAALEWVRANQSKFPELLDERSKQGLITGAASQDPELAFSLINELGLQDSKIYADLARSMKEPGKRDAFIKLFREHLTGLSGSKRETVLNEAMQNLYYSRGTESFPSFSTWFDSTTPSPAEIESVASGVLSSPKSSDMPAIMSWAYKNLTIEKSGSSIHLAVAQWTSEDYQAAGKWLVSAPEGPVKNVSIRAYAQTVAPYEPQTAEQWALTLPAGKDRELTLKAIHAKWPKDDAAGKAAFAEKHGIK